MLKNIELSLVMFIVCKTSKRLVRFAVFFMLTYSMLLSVNANAEQFLDGSKNTVKVIKNLSGLPNGSNPRTYNAWVRLNSNNFSNGTIVGQGSVNSAYPYRRSALMLLRDLKSNKKVFLSFEFQVGTVASESIEVLDDNYHMISAEFDPKLDGLAVRFFLDGKLIQVNQNSSNFNKSRVNTVNIDNSLVIGGEYSIQNGNSNPSSIDAGLVGSIKNLSVWSRALSDEEISDLYSGSRNIQVGLVTHQYITSEENHNIAINEKKAVFPEIVNLPQAQLTQVQDTSEQITPMTGDQNTQITAAPKSMDYSIQDSNALILNQSYTAGGYVPPRNNSSGYYPSRSITKEQKNPSSNELNNQSLIKLNKEELIGMYTFLSWGGNKYFKDYVRKCPSANSAMLVFGNAANEQEIGKTKNALNSCYKKITGKALSDKEANEIARKSGMITSMNNLMNMYATRTSINPDPDCNVAIGFGMFLSEKHKEVQKKLEGQYCN